MAEVIPTVVAEVQGYYQRMEALLLYRGVFDHPIGQAFRTLLEALQSESTTAALRAYSDWFQALAEARETWASYLQRQIAYADNAFSQAVQTLELKHLPPALVQAATQDLALLQQFHALETAQVAAWVQVVGDLAHAPIPWSMGNPPPVPWTWEAATPWTSILPALAQHYRQQGVGRLAQYRVFTWQAGDLQGIAHPDPVRLDQLTAYDHPRQQLIQNTLALLQGYPALNVLLYGSRGTGKSSLVKALLNEYAPQGLRLVEVAKAELVALPQIMERLRAAPQKFIIFVDDLSFEEDDDAFKALKVVLEGSVTARPQNVVVYATSNRRHLVREYFSDR
ncbi:MAG TPA: DUF815 domain-containing protein, partial [Leptolyngbyaceae cyanobacterium M65_K2018_010]|nr:DUF815 domain-containing protein [Leptolyngbyaceae cyanobacterium M65_K2018_010]